MSDTTTFSLRVDNQLLQRIDTAATQRGQNRSEYVLSWLPVRYDSETTKPTGKQQQRQRACQPASKSSPTRT